MPDWRLFYHDEQTRHLRSAIPAEILASVVDLPQRSGSLVVDLPQRSWLFGSGSPVEIRFFGSGSPVEIRLFGRKKRKDAKSQRRKEDRKPPASPSGPMARRGFGLRTRDSPRRDRPGRDSPRTGKKARKCLGIQKRNPLDGGRTKLRTRRKRFFLRTDG